MSAYKTAIDFLKRKAQSLDSMSEPMPNVVTQYSADQHKAEAVEVRLAIARLEMPAATYETLFIAACSDLGLIAEVLGIDPDDGGAVPIMDAIEELKKSAVPPAMKQIGWYNTKYFTFFTLAQLASTRRNQELIGLGELVKVYTPQGQEATDAN